ncbi:42398_t:CDS:2 [Gigaspora margarita]|uniref:42398_t:CDS:1 n=1 Tax=Gigaspora margarita TaxID=4874 RepID=A0ABN7UVY0_GIGMA|nr:42398_t:CDS:2 [Gigaspora margarita]
MSSTSWVKSYNAKLKRLIFNSNMTILELAKKLTACVLEEDKKTEYTLFCASVPKATLVAMADKRSNKAIPSIPRYDSVSGRIAEIFYCK